MAMPKKTDNWDARKERRVRRIGEIQLRSGCSIISLKSRSHPFKVVLDEEERRKFVDYCRKRYAEMTYERANSFGKQECAEADLLERSPDGLT